MSRLACVKDALAYALREMPCGSQVAWGVFVGNQTYVLAAPIEVCAHRGDLVDSLAHLDWRVSWETGSRIGGALVSALRVLPTMVEENVPVPGLVFVTDGQEAPRLSARNRRRADDYAGKVHGVVVGVGGDTLTPMPKYDMDGNYLGPWQPDDVPQMDMTAYRAGPCAGREDGGQATGPAASSTSRRSRRTICNCSRAMRSSTIAGSRAARTWPRRCARSR